MDDIKHNKLKDPPLQVFKPTGEWPCWEAKCVKDDAFATVDERV